ncbi:NAD(P)H-dependent oxidoreductase [Bacillus sp. SS-TM]
MNTLSVNLKDRIDRLNVANTKLQQDIERERQLEKTRKEFISGVSHELKTPLSVIRSFAEGIKDEQEHISWADSITFIYPVWWAGLPAILKGYVDRVFSHGFAYAYGENGIEKLLSGKKGLLLSTMGNTKEAYTAGGMFDAMKKTADVGIFEFTGIETIEHTFYTSVPSVDDSVRKQYLEEVKDVVTSVDFYR